MSHKPSIRTVEELKKLKPCMMSLAWLAMNNITDLADAWDRCHRADWMLWLSNALDLLSDRECRLIACRCVRETPLDDGRKVWDLLTDERSRHVVAVTERYADGKATDEELADASSAAADASSAAADAARAVPAREMWAADAAAAAAARVARADAPVAAYATAASASFAARLSAAATSRAAADAAARATQADIVREIVGNPFRDSAAAHG